MEMSKYCKIVVHTYAWVSVLLNVLVIKVDSVTKKDQSMYYTFLISNKSSLTIFFYFDIV